MLPLPVNISILRKRRRRRRCRAGIFLRSFGIIFILIFFSLRGVEISRSQIRRKRPFLWKGRA
jgi:hypothetical protein